VGAQPVSGVCVLVLGYFHCVKGSDVTRGEILSYCVNKEVTQQEEDSPLVMLTKMLGNEEGIPSSLWHMLPIF